jgi:hypothetical protein
MDEFCKKKKKLLIILYILKIKSREDNILGSKLMVYSFIFNLMDSLLEQGMQEKIDGLFLH